jgi:hypothetical protein
VITEDHATFPLCGTQRTNKEILGDWYVSGTEGCFYVAKCLAVKDIPTLDRPLVSGKWQR